MKKPIGSLLTCGMLCLSPIIADAADFTCTGTEPFWKLEIKDSSVLLQDGNKISGQSKLALKSVKPRSAEGVSADMIRVYEATSNERNARPMTIVVQKREESKCSNGLSDPIFLYDVIVVTQRVIFVGCCENK